MAGLLDQILGGIASNDGIQPDDMLQDLLRRLGTGEAQNGGLVTSVPPPAAAPQPQMRGGFVPTSAPAQSMQMPTEVPPLEPMRELKDYTNPKGVADMGAPPPSVGAQAPVSQTQGMGNVVAQRASAGPAGASPNLPEPTFLDRMGALSKAYNQRGLIGGIVDAANLENSPERQAANATYQFLVKRGMDPQEAQLLIKSPALLGQILPTILGPKAAPQIIKIPGAYGQESAYVHNPRTGKLEPLSSILPDGGQGAAPAAPSQAPAQAMSVPSATPDPTAPSAPVMAGAAPALPAPAAPQLASAPATATPPSTTAAAQGDFVVGRAVPKPPEGFVHKPSPDGKGFLWNRDGSPVFEAQKKIEAEATERAKANEEARGKALAGIDTLRKIHTLYETLDRPFETPYRDKAGNEYRTYGDIVGPWAVPRPSPSSQGVPGQIITAMQNLPQAFMSTARDWKAQSNPTVAQTRRALNELDTQMTALQAARVKELFGSQNLSDADREAAAKTVGTLASQDAQALRAQVSVGERESYGRMQRALDDGLIEMKDIPLSVLQRGVQIGVLPPDIVFKKRQ